MDLDVNGEYNALNLLPNASRNASANGAGVPIGNYIGVLKVVAPVANANGSGLISLQQSNDNGNWVALSANAVTTTSNTAAVTSVGIDTRDITPNAAYIRANIVVSAGDVIASVVAIGKPKQ
jgi:hypothetical protein